MLPKITLTGTIEEVRFYNEDNGWSVLVLDRHNELLVVVGVAPPLGEGAQVQVTGSFTTHPVFGQQFKADSIVASLPGDEQGIERFLASGLIKGIGPALAQQIVRRFGRDTLRVLDEQPDRLLELQGIGAVKLDQIQTSWREQQDAREVAAFLAAVDISANLAVKICHACGANALYLVQNDPFRLALDVPGVGFKNADKIARRLDIPPDHPGRVLAGIAYTLQRLAAEGHIYCPSAELEEQAADLLGVGRAVVGKALAGLPAPGETIDNDLIREGGNIYLASLYYAETGAARALRTLAGAVETRGSGPRASSLLETYRGDLTAEQFRAVETALSHPVSVITGGPGTGKTYTMRALIDTLRAMGKNIALTAPTGRAAKRLAESTGYEAATIHRLLHFTPGEEYDDAGEEALRDPQGVLRELDFLVVDEVSMLDAPLAYRLLRAVPAGCHVLLVGDADQLPSVGPGNVLRDIIASGAVPVTHLTEIFRQRAGSGIVTNAHRINHGEDPLLDNRAPDFFYFSAHGAAPAAELVVDLLAERIPRKFGAPPGDVQVLAPMYRGEAGVHALNRRLQAALNPPKVGKPERTIGGVTFRQGDRVMQTANNYEKSVYNGDTGRVEAIDLEASTLLVSIDERLVEYDFEEAGQQLVLAYAASIHKSQGSEYPVVVVVLLAEHRALLARNLLYTAVTRARQACILVSNRDAVRTAVANNRIVRRWTSLRERLERKEQ